MTVLTTERPMPWPVLILLLLLWGGGPITGLIQGVSLRIPLINSVAQYIPTFLIIFFVILSLPYLTKLIKGVDYLFYIIVVFIYFLNYLIYPQNSEILDVYAYMFLVASVPYYFIGLVYYGERLYEYTAIVSIIALLVSSLSLFVFGHIEDLTAEAMTAGHKCFPHVLMMILCVFVKRHNRLLYLAFAVIGILLLLVYANRMSLLAVVGYVACCLFLMPAETKKKTTRKRIFAVVLVIAAFVFVGNLINGIEYISNHFGTSTRIVDFINEGDALDSNGRDYLWNQMIYYIGQNPFGVGIGGDRLLINTWSHNLFLEILLSFGLLLGSAIILLLIYIMYLGFRYANNHIQRSFLLLLFFAGVFKLQFSSSFLNDNYTFFMVGYCILLYRSRNITYSLNHQIVR